MKNPATVTNNYGGDFREASLDLRCEKWLMDAMQAFPCEGKAIFYRFAAEATDGAL